MQYEKNFYKLGGWLRLFRILTFIGIILFPIAALYAIYIGIKVGFDPKDYINVAAVLVELLSVFIFSIIIFRKICINVQHTPQEINNLLAFMALTSILISSVLFYLYTHGQISIKPTTIFTGILHYIIWTRYFNRSKRVKTFYGSNAGKRAYDEAAGDEQHT